MKTYPSDPFIKKVDDYYFIILTHTHLGTNNGYIAVPPGHYLHSKEYNQINDEYNFNVHWGLNYSGPLFKNLCVDSIDGESLEKYWLIGFDCAHCDDLIPFYGEIEGLEDIYNLTGQTFKDRDFVMNELENLLKQIKEKGKNLMNNTLSEVFELKFLKEHLYTYKKINKPLSIKQIEWLIVLIDTWYINWKFRITDGDSDRFGIAKEELKMIVWKFGNLSSEEEINRKIL